MTNSFLKKFIDLQYNYLNLILNQNKISKLPFSNSSLKYTYVTGTFPVKYSYLLFLWTEVLLTNISKILFQCLRV